jgi:lipoprotein NlpD
VALRLLILVVCGLGAACAPSLSDYENRIHVVQRGDTLYAIAWTYGVDYRSLARWNDLRDPNVIVVGQRLSLRPPAATTTARAVAATAATSPPKLPPPVTLPAPEWAWPTRGSVVSRFGSGKGIDSGIGIAGRAGQPIVASADGRVVYAGTGLIGYGQLVIIKHNDTYLTAYGHTQRLLVEQGQEVARGEQIAQMGLGPQREPRLHFEIRRNGVPVDPLQYLSAVRS